MNGRIKSIKSKGYGFIETQIGIDFFFHQAACSKDDFKELLKRFAGGEKTKVTFDQDSESDRGPRALNIRITKD